jgi:hypothetical protein
MLCTEGGAKQNRVATERRGEAAIASVIDFQFLRLPISRLHDAADSTSITSLSLLGG